MLVFFLDVIAFELKKCFFFQFYVNVLFHFIKELYIPFSISVISFVTVFVLLLFCVVVVIKVQRSIKYDSLLSPLVKVHNLQRIYFGSLASIYAFKTASITM